MFQNHSDEAPRTANRLGMLVPRQRSGFGLRGQSTRGLDGKRGSIVRTLGWSYHAQPHWASESPGGHVTNIRAGVHPQKVGLSGSGVEAGVSFKELPGGFEPTAGAENPDFAKTDFFFLV